MIRTIWLFLILLCSIWIGTHLQAHPGYILIASAHWTIETTLWIGGAILIVTFVCLHLLLNFLSWMSGRPASWGRWREKQRMRASQIKTRQGLIEFSEGHWRRAKDCLIKALPDADTPLLNYLTAARAAQEMGDNQMRDNFLREAQQCMPEAKIAVELTQAQLQLANRQWEQALATLCHLKDIAPRHPYVLRLLASLYEEVKDWSKLIALLPDLKRTAAITGPAFDKLRHHAYFQALHDLTRQDNLTAVDAFYQALPKPFQMDVAFVAIFAEFLLREHQDVEAEIRLRQCLRQQFDEKLVRLYSNSNVAKIDFAESLLKKNPHSSALYLSLGHLYFTHALWGQAKSSFEKSLELCKTPAAYVALATLQEQLGENTAAFNAYREGLRLATDS